MSLWWNYGHCGDSANIVIVSNLWASLIVYYSPIYFKFTRSVFLVSFPLFYSYVLISHSTAQLAPITLTGIGSEKKCSVLDLRGKPQIIGGKPTQSGGDWKPISTRKARVWGKIRTGVYRGERQGMKPQNQHNSCVLVLLRCLAVAIACFPARCWLPMLSKRTSNMDITSNWSPVPDN